MRGQLDVKTIRREMCVMESVVGVRSGELGLGSRIMTPTLPLTPTVFQAADTYFTSHVVRQIFFASNCPCVKSPLCQIFMYPANAIVT